MTANHSKGTTVRPDEVMERVTGSGFDVELHETLPKEVIQSKEVLKKVEGDQENAVILTPKDRVKINFAVWVGVALLLTFVFLNAILAFSLPLHPDINAPDAAAKLAVYKTAWEIARQGYTDIFNLVITRTLLPLFVILLTYALGLRITDLAGSFMKNLIQSAIRDEVAGSNKK